MKLWALWKRLATKDWLALLFALRDKRVATEAKVIIVLTALYVFSPIDIVPDSIPIFGILDDAVVLTAGVLLAEQLIPARILEEHRRRSAYISRFVKYGFIFVILSWISTIVFVVWLLRR